MDSPSNLGTRSSPARCWRIGIGIGGLLLAVSATIPCHETPEVSRYRRLFPTQEAKTIECRRLERLAQAAGRTAEAQRLVLSARNFGWFAEAYRVRLAQH